MSEKIGHLRRKDNGLLIIGAAELIPGTCYFNSVVQNDGGDILPDFGSETEIHWDGQVTQERDGQAVYIDANGDEVLERDCEFVEGEPGDDDELPEPTESREKSDPEAALRATWTAQGVPADKQDELIGQIVGKAKNLDGEPLFQALAAQP